MSDEAGEQAHDGQRGHALAGAGLTHEAKCASLLERQVDVVDGAHRPLVGAEGGLQTFDPKKGC